MSLSISSGSNSLSAQSPVSPLEQAQQKTIASLSSGKKTDGLDPASVAIVQQFAAQIAGSNQAVSNLSDGISLTQVADGSLSQLQSNTDQLRQLAVQAGDGSLSSADRASLQTVADQLSQANSAIVQNSNFNGVALLQGGTQTYQSGPDAGNQTSITVANLAAAPAQGGLFSLAGGVDLSSAASATQSLSNLDQDVAAISGSQTAYGAAANSFSAAVSTLQATSINASAAQSGINDTDYASATAKLAQQQILSQVGVATQAQANASAKQVLSLLQ